MAEPGSREPSSAPGIARARAELLQRARAYFGRESVLEVDTPILSRAATSDPNIESVSATLQIDGGHEYFLHTSPEHCMKRLLCAGYPDIYQVCKVFRDGELGRRHLPEFTMIEWYRRNFDMDEMVRDTLGCISAVLGDRAIASSATRISYRQAFEKHAGLDPLEASLAELQTTAAADPDLEESIAGDRDAWLDLILDLHVAPRFAKDSLTVLEHYPVSQAALSRASEADDRVADRFEVFFGAHELANGYVELVDAGELQRRFDAEQESRRARGQRTRPLDFELLAAVQCGLPPCAGVALGFDRVMMIHTGSDDIRNTQTFAFEVSQ